MLTILRIKNVALVADLTLELQPGYNVITGETGAGKSIVIGALSLVLGERADRGLLRSGSDQCSVEAVFDTSRLKAPLKIFLEENGLEPCENGQLVLKRSFNSAGSNRQFVNGSPATLNTLAKLGEWLVDIHGPHEHQSLLHPAQQLSILDAFGCLEADRDQFSEALRRRTALEAEKTALVIDDKTYAQQVDLLRFQVNEITSAALQPDEEAQLDQDYKRASNSAKLLQLCQNALDVLSESDSSLLHQAGAIGRNLQELQRVDPSTANLAGLHAQALAILGELQAELSRYAERLEIDPARLQEMEERLNLLHALKRKYGPSVAEVQAFGIQAKSKLQALDQRDAEVSRIDAELAKIDAELWRAGQALSSKRRKLIPRLAQAVSKQLKELGFKQSRFEVSLTTISQEQFATQSARPASTGLDTIEFQFAPNPGEPMRPLRAIASSGEMARVMLGLKTVLAVEDHVPVLVFDEVDANVGGETACAVGQKMRQIAKNRQVLCITHLPQVAASATTHFVASKKTKDGRTTSEVTLLQKEERVTEMARMLGGQTEAARKHAEALLNDPG